MNAKAECPVDNELFLALLKKVSPEILDGFQANGMAIIQMAKRPKHSPVDCKKCPVAINCPLSA